MLPALGGCGRESYAAGFAQGASHSPLTLTSYTQGALGWWIKTSEL